MHLAERAGNLHQFAELDGTAEKARCCHDERKHHGGLAKEAGEPDEALLSIDQRQVIAQHPAKAQVELLALHCFATVQRDGLAVFPYPHHVVAKIGFDPLLLEVELDLRATNVVCEHAASQAVQHRHPHHETGDVVFAACQCEGKATRQPPQDADKAGQGDHRIQQPHREPDGQAGELVDIFLDTLVRVVGIGAARIGLRGKARQLQVVERMVGQPALQVVPRHPGAPAHLQQLGQVKLVHRNDDESEGQVGEPPQLGPEYLGVLVLQRVVEQLVPVVEQHRHVDDCQVQANDGSEQQTCFPFFFGCVIRLGQGPHAAQQQAHRSQFGQRRRWGSGGVGCSGRGGRRHGATLKTRLRW